MNNDIRIVLSKKTLLDFNLKTGNERLITIVKSLINNMPDFIFYDHVVIKEKDRATTAFTITNKELELLKQKALEVSKHYNNIKITENKLLAFLISDYVSSIIQEPVAIKELKKEIATYVSFGEKKYLEDIAKLNFQKVAALFRARYSELITSEFEIIETDKDLHTERVVINVTEDFKREFKTKSVEAGVSSAVLLRSLLLKIK